VADFSITEAAAFLALSRSTIRNLADAGESPLPADRGQSPTVLRGLSMPVEN